MPDELAKAIHERYFGDIDAGTDEGAADMVDHSHHLFENPPEHQPLVDEYHDDIHGPAEVHPDMNRIGGMSPKLVVKSTNHKWMLKPYHEALDEGAYSYCHVPIMGWSEMASQALYHAGGIGHLHQKVHVTEHETEPRKKSPMVVIHLDPHATQPVATMMDQTHTRLTPGAYQDAAKIGLMDFLTNNNDRHRHNMHYVPPEFSISPVSRLLAIDNGRAFQYKAPNRHQSSWKNNDHFFFYLSDSPAMRQLNALGMGTNETRRRVHDYENVRPALDWWKENREAITGEFSNQLKSIKNQRLSGFLHRNFHARAAVLDRVADVWAHGQSSDYFNPHRLGAQGVDREVINQGKVPVVDFKPPSPYNRPPGDDEEEDRESGD
jgi:hypothetical protein